MNKDAAFTSVGGATEQRSPDNDNEDELDETEGYFSPSPERKQLIKNLENPISAGKEDYEDGGDSELAAMSIKPLGYPPNPPPSYSSVTGKADSDSEKKDEDSVQKKVGEPVKLPPKSKARGSINEILMTKVAQPFQNMLRRASNRLESSSDEEGEDDLTNDELQLISFMDTFRHEQIEIKPQLRPFLLEHIPAIGDIDCFVKIPRPDELTTEENAPVKKLLRADKNVEEIENWVASIKELHRTRPAQTVHYKGPMPEVEKLMQEWPQQFESQLSSVQLPGPDLDVSTEEFVDICLNLVDIPVHKSRIQSLHLLFSLNSQHFRNLAQGSLPDTTAEHMDRLEL
ncbi:hypothetical protein WR25_25332 [Diploscapter pachys]|uniref:Intraflagellar transport protein 46 homolog n=1 Tax=Diploscapter pachys TaxID=2018661 RepID=A0A2A2JHH1_9BILA|nr:hypothetical protein WR25_25332 [Diploscapter pachys]